MEVLTLSQLDPIASGLSKVVYENPDNPTEYIKVPKKSRLSSQKHRRLPTYWEIAHEIIEHLAIRERDPGSARYLEKVKGLVDTDCGVGLVVDAVRAPGGEPAPTIRDLLQSQEITPDQEKGFRELLAWAKQTDVIIRDFSTNNAVWNHKTGSFVLIDGFGCKPSFSLRLISRSYNRRTNHKKAEKLAFRARDFKASS